MLDSVYQFVSVDLWLCQTRELCRRQTIEEKVQQDQVEAEYRVHHYHLQILQFR
jgi:hypothetical protein